MFHSIWMVGVVGVHQNLYLYCEYKEIYVFHHAHISTDVFISLFFRYGVLNLHPYTKENICIYIFFTYAKLIKFKQFWLFIMKAYKAAKKIIFCSGILICNKGCGSGFGGIRVYFESRSDSNPVFFLKVGSGSTPLGSDTMPWSRYFINYIDFYIKRKDSYEVENWSDRAFSRRPGPGSLSDPYPGGRIRIRVNTTKICNPLCNKFLFKLN